MIFKIHVLKCKKTLFRNYYNLFWIKYCAHKAVTNDLFIIY